MTVNPDPYYHWNSRSDSLVDPYNACSPNLVSLQDYYRRRWGGSSLGCHNQRDVTGGGSLSSHAWGAACDWQFPNRTITEVAMAWTISVSAELGINTIHDYIRQMMWKPGGVGWVPASIGSIGGQWIHVETTPAMFGNGRPVEDKLTGSEAEVALTGDDAKLVAAVVWETMLTFNGVTKTAREWLFDAAVVWSDRIDAGVDGWPLLEAGQALGYSRYALQGLPDKLADLDNKVDNLAVGGIDLALLRQIVREEVDSALADLTLRTAPPS